MPHEVDITSLNPTFLFPCVNMSKKKKKIAFNFTKDIFRVNFTCTPQTYVFFAHLLLLKISHFGVLNFDFLPIFP